MGIILSLQILKILKQFRIFEQAKWKNRYESRLSAMLL